jgi:transcription-repair coupling factor (superfamily II helicase)
LQAKVYEYLKNHTHPDIFITLDDKHSQSISQVTKFLGYKTFTLPDFRASFGDDLRSFKDELTELLNVLREYYNNNSPKKVLVSPFHTLLHPLPSNRLFKQKSIEFADVLKIDELKETLYNWGYEFVELVTVKGEVSFRGDIIDIFPTSYDKPFRITLFDDEIDSIKKFDIITQKTFKEDIESFTLPPALFSLTTKKYQELDKKASMLDSDSFEKDIKSLGFWVLDETIDFLKTKKAMICENLLNELDFIDEKKRELLLNLPLLPDAKRYKDLIVPDIKSFLEYHKNKDIKLIARNEALIKQANLDSSIKYKLIEDDLILNLLGEDEIVISLNKEIKKERKKRPTILLDELKVGDYVVHKTHGIGIFKGLKNTKVLRSIKDFVEIAYQGGDRLLIPVENLEVIDRYIADSSTPAVVDKLGKGSFVKLKEKTRKKLFEIAKEIIQIAAKRELIKAPIISSNHYEIKLFQNDAGFVYTKDQKKTIKEIFEDLKSGKTMDRLLSGDVGFGKTEVAMNALFATVKSGYQGAFIVPTTLLSTQHFKSLRDRLTPYGVKVAKLDRFTTVKEKREILTSLKDGSLDICIGTHALLSVEFKNLALVVLDEEHKFGVKQKEKLKEFKEGLHILSMSATPIPRSLNMALSSIKQYSQLLTPPSEREDVKTFVKEYDKKLIKEIILREIRRGGQLFYIHNNIASIDDKKRELFKIVPNLKVLVLHSKIPPATTEKEMVKFEEKEYDLLLSTSIVESGIHIPNANTIIIENADRFGMADLHQLRGRVGRSSREGYCYMIVKNKDSITDDAKKRLLALESNSYVGSGAILAHHDLEIRGGGNLIGEAQSGHIKGIGYNLYLKMLEDTINTLLNKVEEKEKVSVEVKLAISAFINSQTVNEDRIRLELYRRLSLCQTTKEIYEIEEEMIDRFGKLDEFTKQFLELLVIKILAKEKNICQIMSYEQNITFTYSGGKKEYIKSPSKDDDDIIATTLKYLRN